VSSLEDPSHTPTKPVNNKKALFLIVPNICTDCVILEIKIINLHTHSGRLNKNYPSINYYRIIKKQNIKNYINFLGLLLPGSYGVYLFQRKLFNNL